MSGSRQQPEEPEIGDELGRAMARARSRMEQGLDDGSPEAQEVEDDAFVAEWGSTVSRVGYFLRCAVGMVSGVGLVLMTAFVLSIALPERDFRSWAEALVLPLILLGIGGPILAFKLFPLAVIPNLVVGVDGLLVRGRFIPHARIRSVRHERGRHPGWGYGDVAEGPRDVWTVSLDLAAEGSITLRTTAHASFDEASELPDEGGDASGAHLARTIEAARAAWGAQRGGSGAEEIEGDMVARRDRTGAEWLHSLRQLGASAGAAYRGVAADTERLSRLLDDAQARPSARAAAAVALSVSGDETTARRLRIAAASFAEPRLRIALQRVADAREEEAVAEALVALEEAEREQHT